MILKNVTITGVDENTNLDELFNLSEEYPFVEWGFLVSIKNDNNRFVSKQFIEFVYNKSVSKNIKLNMSMHMCGALTRSLFNGSLHEKFSECIPFQYLNIFKRIQVNVAANRISSYNKELFICAVDSLLQNSNVNMIVQYNDNNISFVNNLLHSKIVPHILYDYSGGVGKTMRNFPNPISGIFCGYAGGIGPDNIDIFLYRISDVVKNGISWIDMESRVRDENNYLDLFKVKKVLDICKNYV